MKIRNKLLLSYGVILALSIISGIAGYVLFQKIKYYNQLISKIERLKHANNESAHAFQVFLIDGYRDENFLRTGESHVTKMFADKISEMESIVADNEIKKIARTETTLENQLKQIDELTKNAKHNYTNYIEKAKQRGFKDYGLEGEMRKKVHFLESVQKKVGLSNVLQLRRHEKDFFLRKDIKYIDKLRNKIHIISQEVEVNPDLNQFEKAKLLVTLENYQKQFDQVVQLEKQLGFTSNMGLKGNINNALSDLDSKISYFDAGLKNEIRKLKNSFTALIIILFIVAIIVSVTAALYSTYLISKPLNHLNQALDSVEKGNKNIDDHLSKIKGSDELGRFAASFKRLYKKLDNTLEEESKKGEKLAKLLKDNETRAWRNEGLATVANILRDQGKDLNVILDEFLSQVVKYLNINQGALFIVNNETENPEDATLQMEACYAYNRKKYLKSELKPGQGLAGQAYLEKRPINLKEVPQDYIKITSGLGETTPKHIIIIPAIFNNQVYAIIELASITEIKSHKIHFVERVAENLAVSLSSIITNVKTNKLLAETQEMAAQMRERDEELRQNLEELQATQDDLHRQQQESNYNEMIVNGMMNSNPDIILSLDANFRVLAFNKACYQKFSQLHINMQKGLDFMLAMKPESRRECEESYKKALRGETFCTYEHFNENGKDVYVQSNYAPLCNHTNQIIGITITSKELKDDFEVEIIKSNFGEKFNSKLTFFN